MDLISGERILLESNTNTLILTTHRVRYKASGAGRADFVSIMLEEVASCTAARRSSPWLLVAAGITFLGGVFLQQQSRQNGSALLVGTAAAVVFVIVYLLTRRQVLTINAAQGALHARMSGGNLKQAEDFVDTLESAKNERFGSFTNNKAGSASA